MRILIIFFLVARHWCQAQGGLLIKIVSPQLDEQSSLIYDSGNLNKFYNDKIFVNSLICKNGLLQMIDYSKDNQQMIMAYSGINPLEANQIRIGVSPNIFPIPTIANFNATHIFVNYNCASEIKEDNYYNKVQVLIRDYRFSFLLNCDPSGRHKKFQFGYFVIVAINGAIIAGVAFFSRVWSIRINIKPLRINLKWTRFLIVSGIIFGFGIMIMIFLARQSTLIASDILQYLGLAISLPFVYLCANQIFFLFKKLKEPVFSIVRYCDIMSIFVAIGMIIAAIFAQNWVLYDFIAGCICIGSIKIFHFSSLKQALLSQLILVSSSTIVSIVMHFVLTRSYNDYTTELQSPLFLQVPDLVDGLYKKCSWLPIFDVIIPGVLLSYLRVYDQNIGQLWGGVYTIVGNLSFLMASGLWIFVEYIYPFSVPFSLVTYPILSLVIFIVAFRRNQWSTLFYGTFQQELDTVDVSVLNQNRATLSKLLGKDDIEDIKYHKSQKSSDIIEQQ